MNLLTIIILLALAATVVVLAWGIYSMAHGGKYDMEHGTQLMFARVGVQGVVVVLLLIALVLAL